MIQWYCSFLWSIFADFVIKIENKLKINEETEVYLNSIPALRTFAECWEEILEKKLSNHSFLVQKEMFFGMERNDEMLCLVVNITLLNPEMAFTRLARLSETFEDRLFPDFFKLRDSFRNTLGYPAIRSVNLTVTFND